jgi:hypothetical protein
MKEEGEYRESKKSRRRKKEKYQGKQQGEMVDKKEQTRQPNL